MNAQPASDMCFCNINERQHGRYIFELEAMPYLTEFLTSVPINKNKAYFLYPFYFRSPTDVKRIELKDITATFSPHCTKQSVTELISFWVWGRE
jgi:hypothetical protein